jgi:hypothetical protein
MPAQQLLPFVAALPSRCIPLAVGVLIVSLMICAGGCASTGDSDIPWNQPQPWEGAPSIPGFTPGGR